MPPQSCRHIQFGCVVVVLVTTAVSVIAVCPDTPNVAGHDTIGSLGNAMRADFSQMLKGNASPPFVYRLCPGVTYRPDLEGAWIEPLADETSIICGNDGSSQDGCIVEGGDLQVALVQSSVEGYVRKRTTFQGITFKGSTGWSVAAYDTSDTTVEFSDCHWTGVTGQVGIQIVHKERPKMPSSPSSNNASAVIATVIDNTTLAEGRLVLPANGGARRDGDRRLQGSYLSGMNVVLRDCSITDSWGLPDQFFFCISNAEGMLIMENVEVSNNLRNNSGTSVAVWNQGVARIERCSFLKNEFDVILYNYEGEANIGMSIFRENRGQSSIGITEGYTGISGNRFIENVFPGSGNIEAKSGYVDVSYCEFLGTISQADIIMYGKDGGLFIEFLCFVSGNYTFTPVFVGSEATLEESTYIYADDLQPRSGQQCVEEPGAFIQAELWQYNYTYCFDDDLTTPCLGTCTNTFDARSCDFKTQTTDEPTASPVADIQARKGDDSSNAISCKHNFWKLGVAMFLLGWVI
eukprot:CAMPEP_0197442646 /NCGR_PEP_ID=MMETSP1175-20131217/8620_1 /TAXON_ID=1003142 /ORGANISM="Triceratium dubium, Strain CCMP147" /LENGTH=519 /DNA_ID=CAMNT_0042973161 /DNA_START=146 /DNA_END=1705 /DNA_ORIENTATION=-